MKSKLFTSEHKFIYKEVLIGGQSKDELLITLKSKDIGINELGLIIFHHKDFITSATIEKLQTVEISIGDLGFLNGANTIEVYQKAVELGLKLCPAELGPHMRLQYIDLNQQIDPPKGNWQNIAMEKLSDEPDFPNGFYLRRREDGFWLRGYSASPEYIWSPADCFIFCLD
jgi:hypothetical protein